LTTKHGLAVKEWAIDDEALLTIIRRYTRRGGACATSSASLYRLDPPRQSRN